MWVQIAVILHLCLICSAVQHDGWSFTHILTQKPPANQICIVVRTYWGHGEDSDSGLRNILRSIQRQSHPDWEAILIELDRKPFSDLARIVQSLEDDRIWTLAEWVGEEFAPKAPDGTWYPHYHKLLYDLTDEAVRACSPFTRWVLITNGDNEYASSTFSEILAARHADIVAFNFYSRYQRATGPPCDRFSPQPGLPCCKPNLLRWCHTDLGANVLNWKRLMIEDRRFGTIGDNQTFLGADNFDGLLAQTLVEEGWNVHMVPDACLFNHDPSPQKCAQTEGVWDDTLELALRSPGGRCISAASAENKIAQGDIEDVIIRLSHDHHLAEFRVTGTPVTQIRCLRDRHTSAARARSREFFGTWCASPWDL